MCEHGKTVNLQVPIPARLSHTGAACWEWKPIDSCLVDIVRALNAGGMLTASCCCGHGKGPACIELQNGLVLRVFGGGVLPWGEAVETLTFEDARLVRSALDSLLYENDLYHGDGLRDDAVRDRESAAARALIDRIDASLDASVVSKSIEEKKP